MPDFMSESSGASIEEEADEGGVSIDVSNNEQGTSLVAGEGELKGAGVSEIGEGEEFALIVEQVGKSKWTTCSEILVLEEPALVF
jgi:hypothetical protein